MMNTRSTKRDCTDDLLDNTDERRQPGNVLDELIAERLRTIIDQTNLHVQQAERFNQLIRASTKNALGISKRNKQKLSVIYKSPIRVSLRWLRESS